MQGKKKYIALILFLFLGLMVFTFANPKEDEEKEDKKSNIGEVVKEDGSKKTTTNGNLTRNQNVVVFNTVNARSNVQTALAENVSVASISQTEEDSYAKALEMVKKAEESLVEIDYSKAQNLVNNLTDGNDKEELQNRLDEVLNSINVIELVANLEKMVKEATSLADMKAARDYNKSNDISNAVSKLENEKLKEELTNRLNDLNGLLSDEDSPVVTGINDGDLVNTLANLKVEDDNEYTITLNGKKYELGTELTEDGEYKLVVVDAAFNETTVTFTYDATPAKVEVIYDDKTPTNKLWVTLKFDEAIDESTLPQGFNKVGENEYKKAYYSNKEYNFVVKDLAGNETVVNFKATNVDKTPAKVDVKYNITELTNKSVTVTLIANEPVTLSNESSWLKVSDTEFRKVFPKNTVQEIVATDLVGNKTDVKIEISNIDKTAPIVTLYEKGKKVEAGKYYTATLKAVIEDNSEYTAILKDNYGNETNYVSGTDITKRANYTLVVTDKAGNKTEISFAIDKDYPLIYLNGTKNEKINKNVKYYNKDVGVKVTDLNLDVITFTKDGKETQFENNSVINEEGNYSLLVTDKANHKTEVNFVIDKTAPVLSVKSDSIGTDDVYSKINFKLSDNVGLAKVIINGKEYVRTGKWNDLNFQNVNNYVEGKNTIVLVDLAGNETKYEFIYDVTAPVYESLRIMGGRRNASDNTYYAKATDKIYVYVVFNEKLNKAPTLKIGNKEYEMNVIHEGNGNYQYYSNKVIASDLEAGVVNFEVYGYSDKAGNVGAKLTNEDITLSSQSKVIVNKTTLKLKLNGSSNIVLESGIDNYDELGALAIDEVNGSVTLSPSQIDYYVNEQLKGTVDYVDMTKPGTYKIIYKYTDKAGNIGVDESNSNNDYVMRTVTVNETNLPKIINATGTVNLDDQNIGFYKGVFYAEISNTNNFKVLEKGFLITNLDEIANSTDFTYENSSEIVNENRIVKFVISGSALSYRMNLRKIKPNIVRYVKPYAIVTNKSNGTQTIVYGEVVKITTPSE